MTATRPHRITLRFLAEPIYVNYAVRLLDFRKQLDQEMEARLKWLDEQRPDHLSRIHV